MGATGHHAQFARNVDCPASGPDRVLWLALSLTAWQNSRSRAGLPYVTLGLSGLAVLNLGALSTPGTLTAVALNWLFVTVSLFIARSFNRRAPWWSIGGLIAGLAIMGIPGTLGFVARQAIINGNLIRSGYWSLLAGGVLRAKRC